MSALATSISQPALPSLNSIFGGVAGGSLNTAVTGAGLDTATNNIVTTLNAYIGNVTGLTGLVTPLTTAFALAVTTAIPTVATIVTDLGAAIDGALSNLAGSLASAGAIALGLLCPELAAFKTFINSIATPALAAVLPT